MMCVELERYFGAGAHGVTSSSMRSGFTSTSNTLPSRSRRTTSTVSAAGKICSRFYRALRESSVSSSVKAGVDADDAGVPPRATGCRESRWWAMFSRSAATNELPPMVAERLPGEDV